MSLFEMKEPHNTMGFFMPFIELAYTLLCVYCSVMYVTICQYKNLDAINPNKICLFSDTYSIHTIFGAL